MLSQKNPARPDPRRLWRPPPDGLLLSATLARYLGLLELVDHHIGIGGDCIDDADALRPGGTADVLGCIDT